jgi:SulP family sulfate permease
VQEQLAKSGALKVIGGANLFDSKTEAIAEIYRRLDREACRTCNARVFRECAPVRIEPASVEPHPFIPAGAKS